MKKLLFSLPAFIFLGCAVLPDESHTDTFTLSIIGTNDVHGQLSASEKLGGLTGVSALVNSLRAVRARDGGAVLLIDAGDMWQGTLESNLTEGASVVAAFNALDYDAVAVGNHEFDFGPTGPQAIPREDGDDPRGALKQRALEADFPLLAANLIDTASGQPVDWPNVRPTTMLVVNDVKVGVIGIMSINALQATIAANVEGLHIAALAPTVTRYAEELRKQGANIVIVTAHAGGRCEEFVNPMDVLSCNPASEIFRLAGDLAPGLVDHIIAGHVHQGIAHVVNDIAITSSYSNTYAVSRVDFELLRNSGAMIGRKLFAPQVIVGLEEYEGRTLQVDPEVEAISIQAEEFAQRIKEREIGIELVTPFTLDDNPESTLGFLFTHALLEQSGADVVLHNIAGGLRATLPAGPVTFNDVYRVFPFDNRATYLTLTGRQLREVIALQAVRQNRSVGFAGMTVTVQCDGENMLVQMRRDSGEPIADDDRLNVLANDYLALGGDGVLVPVIPENGFPLDNSQPLVRDQFIAWLADTGGQLSETAFAGNDMWTRPGTIPENCQLRNNTP